MMGNALTPRRTGPRSRLLGRGTAKPFCWIALPFARSSVISPTFIARLIKGCRGGDRAD